MFKKKKSEGPKKPPSKFQKLKKRAAIGAASLTILFGGAAGYVRVNGAGEGFSNGARVGAVTKFGQEGLLCKSYNGTLTQTAANALMNGDTSTSFNFYATNPEIIKQLTEAEKKGQQVALTYTQSIVRPYCDGKDTNYKVTVVTPIAPPKDPNKNQAAPQQNPQPAAPAQQAPLPYYPPYYYPPVPAPTAPPAP